MFTVSPYHERIFDFFDRDTRNGVVVAVAGSGKTTLLVELLKRVAAGTRVGFMAFNGDIAKEIERRVKAESAIRARVTCATLHGLGYRNLRSAYNTRYDERKLDRVFQLESIAQSARLLGGDRAVSEKSKRDLRRVVSMAKATLMDTDAASAREMIEAWGMEFDFVESGWLLHLLPDILEACARMTESCDYDDMPWIPVVTDTAMELFDLILCDEAQDLNAAQMQLVLKSLAPGGRVIAVGDPRQAIYGFRGADTEAMTHLRELLRAVRLPLSITYRCPLSHVALAKQIAPEIEAAPGAPPGIAREIDEGRLLDEVRPGDMVIGRVNAPLVSSALSLIARGRKALVRGRDVGASLKGLLKTAGGERVGETVTRLNKMEQAELWKLEERGASALQMQAASDKFETLRAILARCETMKDAARVTEQIAQESGGGVIFSTIHRAKGLEAERVFFLHPEDIQHPMAKRRDEIEQEMNALYVGLTRSKRELVLVRRAKEE